MAPKKSLDPYKQIIAALLSDVQTSHSEVFTPRALRLTTLKVVFRLEREGLSFLTKTLPRLGKAFDKALSGEVQFDSVSYAFKSKKNSKLPIFMGELFELIFSHDGWVLPIPCVRSIKTMRQLFASFYKLELPYDSDQEQDVISKFRQTEVDILPYHLVFSDLADRLGDTSSLDQCLSVIKPEGAAKIIYRAKLLLSRLFSDFDHKDIYPRHGPGAVSTKEKLWDKYTWSSISPRIADSYPLDAYFYTSLGHVCDAYQEIQSLELKESPAKVLLVPKDSRGPRLISCEPLAFQWIQQGLGRAIVRHVESNILTMNNVHFSDQNPNRNVALTGSKTGGVATLDLSEASDRVSVGLVRLLFPSPLREALLNCRSLSTVLPGGEELKLNKFAPMGSALCFPILALTCWAILTAGSSDADVFPNYNSVRILVYGDDVIVPTAHAANAIEQLERFGLRINRDKSCTSGFFRESCGMDAYKGVDVTPVRFRTVWSSTPSPEVYTSWIAYANSMYALNYFNTYKTIVGGIFAIYGEVPEISMHLACPSLIEVPEVYRPKRRRVNRGFQTLEWRVRTVRSRPIKREIDGWKMLLRFFAEAHSGPSLSWTNDKPRSCGVQAYLDQLYPMSPFSVSSYTKRKSSILEMRWR